MSHYMPVLNKADMMNAVMNYGGVVVTVFGGPFNNVIPGPNQVHQLARLLGLGPGSKA